MNISDSILSNGSFVLSVIRLTLLMVQFIRFSVSQTAKNGWALPERHYSSREKANFLKST